MLTDHDSLPPFHELDIESKLTKKFQILKKYHLENYFLDENIWAEIFKEMEPDESWLTNPNEIKTELKKKAEDLISYTISLTVSALLRSKVGNVDLMPKNCHSKTKDEVEGLILDKTKDELNRVNESLADETIKENIEEIFSKIQASLEDDSWKDLIPGRPILNHFASKAKLPIGRAKKLYINYVLENKKDSFDDIIDVFKGFHEN